MADYRIKGVSRSTLWQAWKAVRQHLRRAPQRDVLDYVEYDIDPNVWIDRLLVQIRSGEYSPERASRFSIAKSNGFDRIITLPTIPDTVLLRTIVDYLFVKAQSLQEKHVYFSQSTLSNVLSQVAVAAQAQMDQAAAQADYISESSVFLEWLKYDQYRKHLIFEKVYPFIVVTDISNFFDSVLYARVEESLHGLKLPAGLVPLLFHILESLSLREAMTPVQRIGLPVDPCDCSRVLAHMMLFPHDKRMVELVGRDAYVRWMDDQNFGVPSRAQGLRVLSATGASLRKLHLTPNGSKSKVLSLAEAVIHFHFDANAALDSMEVLPYATKAERLLLQAQLAISWTAAVKHEGVGEWTKILSRFYRIAARARSKMYIGRVQTDLERMPSLVARIADYYRYAETPSAYYSFVLRMLADPEQVYSDVNFQLIDGLLRLSPMPKTSKKIREFASLLLKSQLVFPGMEEAKALAPLLILRYGDGRSLKTLFADLQKHGDKHSPHVVRSLCAVVGGSRKKGFSAVQKTASTLRRNHLSEFVRLLERIKTFSSVPGRFKTRVALQKDSITGAPLVDMRGLLAARLIGLCANKPVTDWLANTLKNHLNSPLTPFEAKLLNTHWPKLDHSK